MKIKPINSQILVRPDPVATTTKESLITSLDDPEPNMGIVVDVGQYVTQVKPGQHIMWRELEGMWIDKYLLIDEFALQLVLE